MSNNHKQKDPIIKCLLDIINALGTTVTQRDTKVSFIEKEYPDEKLKTSDYHTYKKRLNVINQDFEKKWISTIQKLDELCKKIRRRQPHLNELTSENINTTSNFPESLAFGRLRLSYQHWTGHVPRLIPFPFKKSLWLPDKTTSYPMIHQLLLRLIHCMSIGSIEITAADPLSLGTSLDPFLSLLRVKNLFPSQRLLTRSDEMENALANLTDYIEDLLQNKFKDKIKNRSNYNSANSNNNLKYKLLLLFGVPEQLTDKSIWYLGRLLEHGPLCGVLTLLTVNEECLDDRKFIGLRDAIEKSCKRMDFIVPTELLTKSISKIDVTEEQEFWPDKIKLSGILNLVSEKYESSSKFNKQMTELWEKIDYWKHDSTRGIQVPIGWTIDGEIVQFSLGGVNTEHHVLLAGRTGSGKSNMLHVLIHSLCHLYSPSELNIYLLDYKQGIEFSAYASPLLPQAKLVATESDPEYGVTVLAHLTKELENRAREFKNRGVVDFYGYREIPLNRLPRILLIIDEFQILFSEGRHIAEPAEKMLDLLLRQGRAVGIHVLLATQTLKGIQSLSMGQLISQIGCKIALACSEEDSAMILGNSNWEASRLRSPPEGIINNCNGAKSANQKFLIPFADKELCKQHVVKISQEADRCNHQYSTKIFKGSQLPEMPKFPLITTNGEKLLRLQLGERLSFESQTLLVTLSNRSSSNLLISGYNDVIHDGLLGSILQSLNSSDVIDEVIYFNARSITPIGASKYLEGRDKKSFYSYNSIVDLNLAIIPNEFQKLKRVLIIDGLDSAKELHSGLGMPNFRTVKKEESPSSQESVKKILEDGPQYGTFVIAFVDNWKRCYSLCKDLLPFLEMRIGFCMNEDDAGSCISGSIGKFKGLENDKRAVFVDRLKNNLIWFRPYITKEL
ncbi:MAG: DUF87 domain-containing protein [Oligoflexia bacterium]|nr:DUF87 domain-containing protein [Oligoflexia bacterium]